MFAFRTWLINDDIDFLDALTIWLAHKEAHKRPRTRTLYEHVWLARFRENEEIQRQYSTILVGRVQADEIIRLSNELRKSQT